MMLRSAADTISAMAPRPRCLGIPSLLVLVACTCTRPTGRPADSSIPLDAADPSWYVPPNGCTGSAVAIRAPVDSLRIQSAWTDTSGDRNAHEAAIARGVPGGWGAVWVEGSGLAIALVDTSRRIEAVGALYSRGYRIDRDLMKARPQPVRWDFAQLDDWLNVIIPRAFKRHATTNAGIDVMHNRIELGARDDIQKQALNTLLASLDVPCYLVWIGPGRTGRPR